MAVQHAAAQPGVEHPNPPALSSACLDVTSTMGQPGGSQGPTPGWAAARAAQVAVSRIDTTIKA